MMRWLAAILGIAVMVQAIAEGNEDESRYPFIPERTASITDAARSAAEDHYRHPSMDATGERYLRFMAGINREWLIAAHELHRKGLPLDPDASTCREQSEALSEAARNQPFSLHLALIEQRCAALLTPRKEARIERRVEANFARLVKAGQANARQLMPIFHTYDARAFVELLGYRIQHQMFSSTSLNELRLMVLAAAEPDEPDATREYKPFFFNLLGDEAAAARDDDRFGNSVAQYLRWIQSLSGLSDDPTALVLELRADGEKPHVIRERLLERELDVATSVSVLGQCSAIDPCPEHVLEPLLEAADRGDPWALMAVASERLLGQVKPANVEEGMVFWTAAQRVAGDAALTLASEDVFYDPHRQVRDNLYQAALRGEPSAQLLYLGSIARAMQSGQQTAAKSAEFGRVRAKLARDHKSARHQAAHHLAEMLANPEQFSDEVACRLLDAGASSFADGCSFWLQSQGKSVLPALLQASASLMMPEERRKAARLSLIRAFAAAGRQQEAVDAWLAFAIMEDEHAEGLAELLLKGFRPSQISLTGMLHHVPDARLKTIRRIQWHAGRQSEQAATKLYRDCAKDVNACHALIPILFQLAPNQREIVLERCAEDDPESKLSQCAELRARLQLRSGDPKAMADGLVRFEALAVPSDAAVADYLMLRCAASQADLRDPSKAYRLLPRLIPNERRPELAETIAICFAANGMMAAAIGKLEQLQANLAQDSAAPVAAYRQRIAYMLSQWRSTTAPLSLPWRHAPNLPLLELARTMQSWAGGPQDPSEFAKAKTELRLLKAAFDKAIVQGPGNGLAVKVDGGHLFGTTWNGRDEFSVNPLFLRESRADRVSLADGKRACTQTREVPSPSSESTRDWKCIESKFSTDFLGTDIENHEFVDVRLGAGDPSSCRHSPCLTLDIYSVPFAAEERRAGRYSLLFLERLAQHQRFDYGENDKLVYRSKFSESLSTTENIYEFGQTITDIRMPTRCEAPVRREDKGETVILTGTLAADSTNKGSPVVEIGAELLGTEAFKQVEDLLSGAGFGAGVRCTF